MSAGVERILSAADYVILLSMVLTLGGLVLAAVLGTATLFGITALLVLALLLGGALVTREPRLLWLLPFGLVAGILELWADWVHVTYIHSLAYSTYFGVRLLASPSYMPLGWWVTVVQFGYLALRLADRWPPARVTILLTALGIVLPPWYEELAARAHAWRYTAHGAMLGHTPLWVVATYACCVFVIATVALLLYRPGEEGRALLAGIYTGAGITLASILCFSLVGSP
jgi:hypothetical protein